LLLEKIVLLAIVFSSLPFAFSESTYTQEESLIMVPFDYSGHSCWLESETLYQCTWQGEIDPFTIEDLEQFKHVLTDEQYEEQIQKLEIRNAPVIEEPVMTPHEKKIQALENKLIEGKATVEDSVLYNLLSHLSKCEQGMDSRTAPFQNPREFTVSEWTQWKINHVEYKQEIGILTKAFEECRGQQVIYKLSAGYENMPTGEDDIQYSLLTEYEGVQALDFELYNKNSNRIDKSAICDNNQYTWSNKIMMGCEDTRIYDGITHKGTSGTIKYFSQIMGEYNEYLQNNNKYATSEDKVNAEKLAEPIAQEMLESNLWYNRE
jgi:hypothetical protein